MPIKIPRMKIVAFRLQITGIARIVKHDVEFQERLEKQLACMPHSIEIVREVDSPNDILDNQ